ncbi:helix-turn-helix domain-containing protein [Paractinoplanes maris]|uniref:helix-turn-helix domain-containing protein n=1 Tax=Paractinoplanes maris TaxID=1734446 RepID=UPI0020229A11|nr:helix-turn-helix transcriptional regulator [Actinoplanes maris]
MEIVELGARLRHRRTAAGRTIASVAADAGLSVPYIANLENGRGNPTLSALSGLAAALDLQLDVRLAGDTGAPAPAALPESLVKFSRSARFRAETPPAERSRRLGAMAAMGALAGRPPTELDWHRLLDVVVLLTRDD